jgi:hypothetical protein
VLALSFLCRISWAGAVSDVFEYMYVYGLPDESCKPWTASTINSCSELDICMNCMPIIGQDDIADFRCWKVKLHLDQHNTANSN